ncbi:MAG: methyltransferase, partial [candidate division KSB1 bacterium]|nr:methyltransferase [candidate division KSB1 bacterium]
KQHSKVHVFLHSCGSIYALIPDLIDAGVEVLNPVQTSAKDMEPARLKKEFGDRLTFWGGGVDTQSLLPEGSPEEIAAQVEERMRIFAPGGGYVFTQVHNIQANVPPENVVAAYDAAIRCRTYPIRPAVNGGRA